MQGFTVINWADCLLKIGWADCLLKRADQSNLLVKPALAGALVILLAYMGILSSKKYIADRIIEAQTKQFIVTIKPNRKCGSIIQQGGRLHSLWHYLIIKTAFFNKLLRNTKSIFICFLFFSVFAKWRKQHFLANLIIMAVCLT